MSKLISYLEGRRAELVSSLAIKLRMEFELEVGQSWVEVNSLGQFRKIIGGRFDTLKEAWTSVGLPLRKHRGDQSPLSIEEVVKWEEFENFLKSKGYSLKPGTPEVSPLFYLKKN